MPSRGLAACLSRIVAVTVSGLCLLVFCGEKVDAQQATALLTGTIKDSTGAVVPGAKVTLKNSDTNIARNVNSDKNGDFLFTLIPIGKYEVDIEKSGFSKYVRNGIMKYRSEIDSDAPSVYPPTVER